MPVVLLFLRYRSLRAIHIIVEILGQSPQGTEAERTKCVTIFTQCG
jgi:hypothetical protein